jgi:hypothetical protein
MSEQTAAENAEQEKQLLAALEKLLEAYSNYDGPYLRKDGDIVVPLDAILKKNRSAYNGLATAFSEMMSGDVERRRSSTWVE